MAIAWKALPIWERLNQVDRRLGEMEPLVAQAPAYVSNASLSHPIASEWVDVYQYLLTQVMGEKVPEELRKESLDDYNMGLLRELKEWIWCQRVKAREERGRAERRKAREEAAARAPKQFGLGI